MRIWILLIVGVAGLGLGFLLQELLGPRAPQASQRLDVGDARVDLAPLTETLASAASELGAELRLLRQSLERHQPSEPARRVPIDGEGMTVDFAPLVASMERLDQQLAGLSVRTAASGPTRGNIPANLRLPAPGIRPVQFPSGEEITGSDFGKRHFLLSYQEVLDSYGVPDSAWVNQGGELVWTYRKTETQAAVDFSFFDGLVVRCDY